MMFDVDVPPDGEAMDILNREREAKEYAAIILAQPPFAQARCIVRAVDPIGGLPAVLVDAIVRRLHADRLSEYGLAAVICAVSARCSAGVFSGRCDFALYAAVAELRRRNRADIIADLRADEVADAAASRMIVHDPPGVAAEPAFPLGCDVRVRIA